MRDCNCLVEVDLEDIEGKDLERARFIKCYLRESLHI